MIKFFRRIRQNLIGQNRISKYVIYAVGEIILVVIGILIALQINNWNEEGKLIETNRAIYRIIIRDLETDRAEIKQFLNNYDSIRKPVFKTLLENEITLSDWKNNPDLKKGFGGFKDIQINTRGYDLFKNQPTTVVIEQGLASDIANFYNKHLYEIDVGIRELSADFSDNNLHLKNKGFLKNYVLGKSDQDFFKYISEDIDAKNRLASYYLFYSIYAEELRNFHKNAGELIIKINLFLHD